MCFLWHHAKEEVLLNEIYRVAEGIINIIYHGQLLPFIIKKCWADQCQAFKRRIKDGIELENFSLTP